MLRRYRSLGLLAGAVLQLLPLGCNSSSGSGATPCENQGGVCSSAKVGCPAGYGPGGGNGGDLCPTSAPEGPMCCTPNGTGLCNGIVCEPRSLCAETDTTSPPACFPSDGGALNCGTITCGSGCTCQSPTAVPPSCLCQ